MKTRKELTESIRQYALHIGFDACGFAKAGFMEPEARRLEEWLVQDRQASMQWMGNHFEKRTDPTLLVPGAKTVISVLASYYHPDQRYSIGNKKDPLIAKYALGRDYHKVLKKKLNTLFDYIKKEIGNVDGRVFVDSAPVLDKAWAVRAGLGWIGKNSNLLNKEVGSFFLIGELILDLDLSYDAPQTDHCGSCTQCMDACPTNAIYEPYRVDASKCISYWTIEHKGDIPEHMHSGMENWVFGCDICQDVCPWNSHAKVAQFSDLNPRSWVIDKPLEYWSTLGEDEFNTAFEGSPVKRTKHEGFMRNLLIVKENTIN